MNLTDLGIDPWEPCSSLVCAAQGGIMRRIKGSRVIHINTREGKWHWLLQKPDTFTSVARGTEDSKEAAIAEAEVAAVQHFAPSDEAPDEVTQVKALLADLYDEAQSDSRRSEIKRAIRLIKDLAENNG